MSMKKRARVQQEGLWIPSNLIAGSPGHPFYDKLEKILHEEGFDTFVEKECAPHYSAETGRPSIPPGVYFRMLLVGYFERIDSERAISWRCADSLSLRRFLGVGMSEKTPHHSSLTRIRSRLPLDVYQAVFSWVLRVLASYKLIDGKTIGVDATTLEANAALRSIVRRDTGEGYREYLEGLAKASGIESPTRPDLEKLDKRRPKKGSNEEWKHPEDPEAQITKMKDGSTHLAHKLEHGVDMSGGGAVLAVTLHGGAVGDTKSLPKTVEATEANLKTLLADPEVGGSLHEDAGRELVADKGYHGNAILEELHDSGHRTYISEPDRGRRRWKGKAGAKEATYGNRRRIRGRRGKHLLRKRGELLERPFAHYLEAGGMRRTHLRGHENILKRLLVHVGAFNLGILMRWIIGKGTPREYAQGLQRINRAILRLLDTLGVPVSLSGREPADRRPNSVVATDRTVPRIQGSLCIRPARNGTSSTGC
jgi:transposase